MSRISLIEESQAPLSARPFYANGDPGPIISSFAHVPELLGAAAPFIGAAFGPSSISGWEARTRLEDGVHELAAWAKGEPAEDNTEQANSELRELGIIR